MESPLNIHDSALEELTAHISDLERRVSILEREKLGASMPISAAIPAVPAIAARDRLQGLSSTQSGALAAIGKGFLGIAGAYMLRALSESRTVPQLAVVIIAFAYAAVWLVWATRAHDAKFESAAYAATAALIFSPMVWELTLRFKVLPHEISAMTLLGFVVFAAMLAWKRKLTWLAWAATLLPVATAVTLLVATRDPVPYVLAVLLMALLTEYAGLHDRWRSLRVIVALLVDLAAILLIAVYWGEASITSAYKPVSTATLLALTSGLFLVYGGGIVFSTVVLGRAISFFDVGQMVVTFLIAVLHALRLTHYSGLPAIAVFCLAAGIGSYFAAFTRFDSLLLARNCHVFATWGAALILIGTLCFSQRAVQVLGLNIAAVIAVFAAIRLSRWSLGFHGAVYLGMAGYLSRLWIYAARALVGSWPPAPGWTAWLTALSAVVCCGMMWRAALADTATQMRNQRNPAALRLIYSSLIGYVVAASVVSGIVWLLPRGLPLGAPTLSVLRTLVVCALILVFSFTGARWNHVELVRIAYGAIVLGALKLLFEDLRLGTPGSLAISLLFYGSVFVLVPRFGHSRTPRT